MASYRIKPSIPVINWSSSITKGLVSDIIFYEKAGSPADIVRKISTTNTSATWGRSYPGYYLNYSGSSQYVTFSSPLTRTGGQPITISAVFSFTGSSLGNALNVRNGSSGAGNWTAFRVNANAVGAIDFLHDAFVGPSLVSSNHSLNDGKVHHAVGTYDGNNTRLYIDGVLDQTSSTYTNLILSTTNNWRFGARSDSNVEYIAGRSYSSRVWSRCLDESEVKLLYENPWIIYKTRNSYLFNRAPSGGISATGGTITTDGIYTVHTFTSNGTFTVIGSGTVDALVVAGGGGGASGGGGGGGYQYQEGLSVTPQAYSITVGAGGTYGDGYAGSTVPTAGSNSVFSSITATGGGKGGTNFTDVVTDGGNGGSGGGGAYSGAGTTVGGTGSQGNNGGTNGGLGSPYPAGGGGGASAVGETAPNTTTGGAGGAGKANSISGSSVTYAGGGGGGVYGIGTGGAGGAGGGGAGNSNAGNGTNGNANTGGGGGGTGNNVGLHGGNGGSGIVIIRYVLQLASNVSGRSSLQSRANLLNLQRL